MLTGEGVHVGTTEETPTSTTLSLSNTSKALDVLYRIQTTSPATYRVRPSHGRIATGGRVDVQIVMVTEPVKADKFLVKYVTVAHSLPAEDFLEQFQAAQASSQERLLRVSVSGATAEEPHHKGEGVGGREAGEGRTRKATEGEMAASGMERTGSMASVASMRSTASPAPHSSASPAEGLRGGVVAASTGIGSTGIASAGIASTGIASTGDAAGSAAPQNEELQRELKEARARIQVLIGKNQELTKALDDAKQVRRREGAASSTAEEAAHPATKLPRGISEQELNSLISAQAGFPPVLVILIALFAFLVGLLF